MTKSAWGANTVDAHDVLATRREKIAREPQRHQEPLQRPRQLWKVIRTALREHVTNVRQGLNWARKNVRTVITRYVTDASKRLQLLLTSLSAEQMNRWLRETSQLRSADIDVAMSNFFQLRLFPSEHLDEAMTTLPFHDLIFRSERSRYNTHFLWRRRSSHG